MDEAPKDYEEDEIVVVKLPRKDFIILKDFLAKQAATNWLGRSIRYHWVWIVGPGVLGLMYLINEIKAVLNGH